MSRNSNQAPTRYISKTCVFCFPTRPRRPKELEAPTHLVQGSVPKLVLLVHVSPLQHVLFHLVVCRSAVNEGKRGGQRYRGNQEQQSAKQLRNSKANEQTRPRSTSVGQYLARYRDTHGSRQCDISARAKPASVRTGNSWRLPFCAPV